MQNHTDTLREITQFYSGLETELSSALQRSGVEGEPDLTDFILQNRTRLAQVGRMSARFLQISEDFKNETGRMDAETKFEANRLAAEAKSQAVRIHELCCLAVERIEPVKNALKKNLEEIRNGKQYLKSVYPVKNNYPKFIDSTG